MTDSKSKRHQIENEVVFRQYNERVQQKFDEVKSIAEQDKQEEFIPDEDMPLLFYCECSDENCRKRILMKPSTYAALHRFGNRFIITPGHATYAIERIVKEEDEYSVVEKYLDPPKTAKHLNSTDVDNS